MLLHSTLPHRHGWTACPMLRSIHTATSRLSQRGSRSASGHMVRVVHIRQLCLCLQALYDAVTAQAAFSSAPLAAPMAAPGTQATSEGTTASPAGTTASPAATTASPAATTASPAADAASSSPAVTGTALFFKWLHMLCVDAAACRVVSQISSSWYSSGLHAVKLERLLLTTQQAVAHHTTSLQRNRVHGLSSVLSQACHVAHQQEKYTHFCS